MKIQKEISELKKALFALMPQFVLAALFGFFSSMLVLAPTGYMLEVYGRVVDSRSFTTLAMLTGLVILVYIVMEVLEWSRIELMREASLKFDTTLNKRIFNAIFEANLKRIVGGTIQPMNDFRTIREFIYSPVLMASMEIPTSIVFLILIFYISSTLGWAAVVGAVIQTILAWATERTTQPPLVAANRAAIAAQQYADGSLRNAEVIESMGMLTNIHRRWMRKQREFLGLQALASDRAGAQMAVSHFVQQMQSSMLLGLGCLLLLSGQMRGGGGMMIVGSILGGRVLAPVVQVIAQWRTVINVRDSWQRLEQLLTNVPTRIAGMPLPAPTGNLRVERVTAGAPGVPVAIITGIAFALKPGEVLAVVGPSASGKTTLARLLVGLWPAASGKVRLDGVDMFSWNKSELGEHIGYLPQGVELFDGSMAENISRFGEIDLAKVEAAARAVGLHELIMALPQGYDSPVGRDGARLSGGQRQRVALARAIYGNPVFVVLDEPNSNLDEAGEFALAELISQRKAQGTTFVVNTHRTNILTVIDKILVLRDGTMQYYGPRDEVLAALKKDRENTAPVPVPTPTPTPTPTHMNPVPTTGQVILRPAIPLRRDQ